MQAIVTENQTIIEVPDGAELIDDVFYVWKTRFGLFTTMTRGQEDAHWRHQRWCDFNDKMAS